MRAMPAEIHPADRISMVDHAKPESPSVSARRAKARWLKRVMYGSHASDAQKCFAYLVADHFNSVTMDCWPSQETIARLLGKNSTKSAQRAARGLEAHGLLRTRAGPDGKRYYAPVFIASDWTKSDRPSGQVCSDAPDNIVQESSLSNPLQESSSNGRPKKAAPAFDRRQRGKWEVMVARQLGPDGIDILEKLSAHDDDAVDRLCQAIATNSLTQRDLAAARLAAEQIGGFGSQVARRRGAGGSNV